MLYIDIKTGSAYLKRTVGWQLAGYQLAEPRSDIDYDDATHSYKVFGNEKKSVTQLLDEMGYVSPFSKREPASDRGKAIHRMIQLYNNGKFESLDGMYSIYQIYAHEFEQYKTFIDDYKLTKPDLVEQVVYNSEYDYAGTLDLMWKNAGIPGPGRYALWLRKEKPYKIVDFSSDEYLEDWKALLRARELKIKYGQN